MIVRLALSLVLAVVGAGIPLGSGTAERLLGSDSVTTVDGLVDGIVDGTVSEGLASGVTMADLDAAAPTPLCCRADRAWRLRLGGTRRLDSRDVAAPPCP